MKRAVLAVLFLLIASAALAQTTVMNPTRAVIQGTYTQDEYADITEFRLAYYSIPAGLDGRSCNEAAPLPAQPVQVVVMPKPAVWTGSEAEGPLPSRPLGCYRAKAYAVAHGLLSDISPGTSGPFGIPPASPSLVIR